MSASAQARRVDPLTKKLRDFSEKYVKIAEDDMARSRELVEEYIEGKIITYFGQNSPIQILRSEYTGSVYEGLKTEAADEVDIMVVLRTTSDEITDEDTGIPNYARLKASPGSNFLKYASRKKYIIPERLRKRWFYSLVDQAVNAFNNSSSYSDVRLEVRYHGPAVQVDIKRKATNEILLSTDLVPSFQCRSDDYFVAKPYTGRRRTHDPERLWRQSFSLKEKAVLQHMDRDSGCRHELLRIVKTIVKRQRTSFAALESYHLKTAFMHYIKKNPHNWAGQNALGEHFRAFLRELQTYLERKNLPHFWLPGVNLLEDIQAVVVEQMANRLKRILNSEAEMNKVLE